jgi:hypothetical protein
MLTGFSRTGSNLVLRVLGSHQEIVAYRPYQYEPRVLTYWADVFRELTEPAAYLRQIVTAGRIAERGWWLGLAPPMPRPLFDADVQGALALDTVEDAADFCRGRIARVYERIAAATARPDARLFAEKLLPGAVPTIAWELYPDAREVFLVRDFRDMVASVLAWKARFGGTWFGHAAARTDEEFVRSFEGFAEGLVASWRRRSDRAHLLRSRTCSPRRRRRSRCSCAISASSPRQPRSGRWRRVWTSAPSAPSATGRPKAPRRR